MDEDIRKQSRVDVVYVYERLNDILNSDDLAYAASRFLDELAHNFHADTGVKIGEVADNG
tara:strand:- start:223 stop:402 length:180 start_codon:yes stop_codon:yes gene_type:complete